jgi:hypothetical protein
MGKKGLRLMLRETLRKIPGLNKAED